MGSAFVKLKLLTVDNMAILDRSIVIVLFKILFNDIQRNQNHQIVNVTLAKYDLLNKDSSLH
jgi:hypothetical protein